MAEIVIAIATWCSNGGIMKDTINEVKACKQEVRMCIHEKHKAYLERVTPTSKEEWDPNQALWVCLGER